MVSRHQTELERVKKNSELLHKELRKIKHFPTYRTDAIRFKGLKIINPAESA